MNKNDSERIVGLLYGLGLSEAKGPEEADVLFINTCSVRQHAEDRVYGIIRNWQKLRKKKSDLIIGVTGCLPGRDQDGKLRRKLKGVDLFFPISELPMLPARLRELDTEMFKTDFENLKEYWQLIPKRKQNFSAFITIQNGCNNFCTYCVVPYSRGREVNRRLREILEEVKEVLKKGGKEVILLGQVVNNYKISDRENISQNNPFKDKDDFATLLWEVNQFKGIERINWTAADPQYFNEYQIQALTLPKQVNYLHLPVQSGDNDVLKRMNRKYTREYYINLIKKIRKAKLGITIGTDIIVGFCGETKEQFNNSLDLYRQCDFDISYQAMYSERNSTVAAKMFKDDVPREEKKRRWQALQDLMEKTVLGKNQKYVGQTISVLVDRYEDGYCYGNSLEMKLVGFEGNNSLLGEIVEVEIEGAMEWILNGKLRN